MYKMLYRVIKVTSLSFGLFLLLITVPNSAQHKIAWAQKETPNVPPNAPSNLRVTGTTISSITIGWDDNSNNEQGFNIYKWNGADFVYFGSVGANVTTFTHTDLPCEFSDFYKVSAYNSSGESVQIGFVEGRTTSCAAPPNAPSNLQVTGTTISSITIGWDDNSNNEQGFNIYKWNGADFVYFGSVGANVTTFTHSDLPCEFSDFYKVSAYNNSGESVQIGFVEGRTTSCAAPNAPSNLRVTGTTISSITIGWDDNSNNEQGFNIYKWNGADFVYFGSVGANVTTFTHSDLPCEFSDFYKVSAYNNSGESVQIGFVEGRTTACHIQCDTITEIPQQECRALQAFFDSTDGSEWGNWFTTNTPCSTWRGLECDVIGHITSIDLDGDHLIQGSLPEELGNLSYLEYLNFGQYSDGGRNQLSGGIPASLGQLSRLKTLLLDNNQLGGSIPPELGQLANLGALSLENNQFNGFIPSSLGNLRNLQSLDLSTNEFSGALPNTLTNLNLDSFYFNWTQLCEPPSAEFQAWLSNIPSLGRTNVLCNESNYSLSGRIENNLGAPIPGVVVSINTGLRNTTNAQGFYSITDLPVGMYTVTPEKQGYTFSPKSTEISLSENTTVDFVGILSSDCDTNSDVDGDFLLDGWEICGYDFNNDGIVDVNLPEMGADPNVPDIFVEIDWMRGHKPNDEAIKKIVDAFARAPIYDEMDNLVGTKINLHIDRGPDSINFVTGERWGNHSRGGEVVAFKETLYLNFDDRSKDDIELLNGIITNNFLQSRRAIFHYSLWTHKLEIANKFGFYIFGSASGVSLPFPDSPLPYPAFLVSLGGFSNGVGSPSEQAGTFMHELGHNLGLQHGGDSGDESFNYKPNYLSVMNYSFQMGGLIIDGVDGFECDNCFDYSRFDLPDLVESNLYEDKGLNGGNEVDKYGTKYLASAPWLCLSWPEQWRLLHYAIVREGANDKVNWSCDWSISSSSIRQDINGRGGDRQTLTGYNDWANIDLNFAHRNLRRFGGNSIVEINGHAVNTSESEVLLSSFPQELTVNEDRAIPRLSEVRVQIVASTDTEQVSPASIITYLVRIYTVDMGSVESFTPIVTLPAGFAYVENSTEGDISEDPTLVNGSLTWSPVTIPDNSVVREFSFQIKAGSQNGIYQTHFSGTSSTDLVLPYEVEVEIVENTTFLPLIMRR